MRNIKGAEEATYLYKIYLVLGITSHLLTNSCIDFLFRFSKLIYRPKKKINNDKSARLKPQYTTKLKNIQITAVLKPTHLGRHFTNCAKLNRCLYMAVKSL